MSITPYTMKGLRMSIFDPDFWSHPMSLQDILNQSQPYWLWCLAVLAVWSLITRNKT